MRGGTLKLDSEHFAYYKLAGFTFVFLIAALIQLLLPYKSLRGQILKNWKTNFLLAFTNTGLTSFICASCACAWSQLLHLKGIGLFNLDSLPAWLKISITLLALDATAYFWHRMKHRYKILWRFHSVHHSDSVYEASTAIRFHIGELLLSLLVRLAVIALFGLSVSSILIFELVYQFFNIFEHGNIRLPLQFESLAAKVFVTPAFHRKHHSAKPRELNSNYGTVFSFWDRIGSSYQSSSSIENIKVGLPQMEDGNSFFDLLRMPIGKR